MLVFFGYTHCPDVCPTEMQNMADVMEKLGPDAKQVAPVFISVDPVRDTPEALSAYVKNFSPLITGLTGSRKRSQAWRRLTVFILEKRMAGPEDYTVDHSVFVYLMDREGNYITHFMFNTPAENMVSVIKKHISGDKGSWI